LGSPARPPGCRRRHRTARLHDESRARCECATATGVDEVNSVSYLPATFTTLFFLAASLLLGLIR
jgi:hypothetical protein